MLFTEPVFLVFFAVVFCVYWALRGNGPRKVLLLIASYVFYGAWDWRFTFLIFVSTAIDYVVGLVLLTENRPLVRKRWLMLSLCANLGILGFFKYYDFFLSSSCGLLNLMGLSSSAVVVNGALRVDHIILPVGISFFTFQSMSYTIDVYRGRLKPIRSFLDFALFVSFFPQLVAGPIVRAADFLPQLVTARRMSRARFKAPMGLFLVGFFKKACIADNLAPYVDRVFGDPGNFDAVSIWIAVLFYAVQIYCDFSGYTDMAIALARMLGYRFCVNFRFPYLASNIQDFWRRWHISLSSWLRDYLYIPLGGSMGSRLFRYRNLMLTMLLGGLWHGASWNFVVWGGLHGAALAVHRLYSEHCPENSRVRSALAYIGMPLTFYWVCIAWVFFRAGDLRDSFQALKAVVLFSSPGDQCLPVGVAWILPVLALVHWFFYKKTFEERIEHVSEDVCAVFYGAFVFVILLFMPFHYRPFVYFQF